MSTTSGIVVERVVRGMSREMHIDGCAGQALRTALALAAREGRQLRLSSIRAGRERPGLRLLDLACAHALAELCNGELRGDDLGHSELFFAPGAVRAGEYCFSVEGAGSACLLFQTVLLPLLSADGSSTVIFEGGTHTPFAPPFEFLERVYLPLLHAMGANVSLRLERRGFAPECNGRFVAEIEGNCRLSPIELCDAGPVVTRRATALVANLPGTIAIRELREVRNLLQWKHEECLPKVLINNDGPANVLLLEVARDNIAELASVVGVHDLAAEAVAAIASEAIGSYLESGAPVGLCLADQLVIPFALAGAGGRYRTCALSEHTQGNIELARRFLGAVITIDRDDSTVVVGFESEGEGERQ